MPLLASRRPTLTMSVYTLGVFLGGLLSGVVVALGLQEVTDWIVENIDGINQPGTVFLVVQGFIGIALIVMGTMLLRARPPRTLECDPASEAGSVTLVIAGTFALAIIGMFARLPSALPYLATVDRLLKMPTPSTMKLVGLVYHNLVLIVPHVLLLVLLRSAPTRSELLLAEMQRWVRTWGRKAIAILLIGLGALLVADYVGSRFGHPVLPVLNIRGQQAASPGSAARVYRQDRWPAAVPTILKNSPCFRQTVAKNDRILGIRLALSTPIRSRFVLPSRDALQSSLPRF
jgi:hypothetical protein